MKLLRLTLLLAAGIDAGAATVYNESISGDLSNSGLAPTVLAVSLGSNVVTGTTGRTTAVDRDYFTINVPDGLQIASLFERTGTAVGDAVSFIGVQAGNQLTLPANTATANGLLGWTHYGTVSTDADILPAMGIAAQGSSGFNPPLPSGNYAFWVQDFGAGTFAYSFDIRVTATPEPSSFLLAGIGLLLAWTACRRRTRYS